MNYYQKSECGCEFETDEKDSKLLVYIDVCKVHMQDVNMRQKVADLRAMFNSGLRKYDITGR